MVLALVNTPFAWHKFTGGVTIEWIGYQLDVGRFEMGITTKRTAWVRNWLAEKIREKRIALGELREGLGRLQFVAGPLELIRPFLGPLYCWACAGLGHARPRLPTMLLLILRYLEGALGEAHMAPCRTPAADQGELFRIDTKAEGIWSQ